MGVWGRFVDGDGVEVLCFFAIWTIENAHCNVSLFYVSRSNGDLDRFEK